MKGNVPFLLLALLLSGCVLTGSSLSSRGELEQVFSSSRSKKDNWYYCGTEAGHHHFLTRMGGNSRRFIVPEEQIKLPATVPLPPSGVMTIRQVDPGRDFAFGPDQIQWSYRH